MPNEVHASIVFSNMHYQHFCDSIVASYWPLYNVTWQWSIKASNRLWNLPVHTIKIKIVFRYSFCCHNLRCHLSVCMLSDGLKKIQWKSWSLSKLALKKPSKIWNLWILMCSALKVCLGLQLLCISSWVHIVPGTVLQWTAAVWLRWWYMMKFICHDRQYSTYNI